MNFSTREFDYGIDLTLHEVTTRTNPQTGKRRFVESGRTLDLQIKSTMSPVDRQNTIAIDLDVDCYDDLRDERVATPRILVVHILPQEEALRVQQQPDELVLRGSCFWRSLKGCEPVANSSTIRIAIPTAQTFSAVDLARIMDRLRQGGTV